MMTESSSATSWQPLPAADRRVIGVLVEKAKTTPDAYPLTLNAIRTGANQKSNRYPVMELDEDSVEESLERLRELGVVIEVQGSGRVPKFRHVLYEWLGVEKTEMAVMAELLLRGAQTIGELRGRAARMEPIADLAALRPILDALEAKRLIVFLSPKGRGCVVTHNLYKQNELERLRQKYGVAGNLDSPPPPVAAAAPPQHVAPREVAAHDDQAEELRTRVEELQQVCDTLRADVDDIRRQLGM